MHVLATAGHVDHGKSALVRALTGMEPDRWAEEQRRGMTIDLGYAWTSLPSGAVLAFVDVPGHARFLGNMLAGLGPAAGVLVVVAADQGWRQQSTEHLAAVDALGLTAGVIAVTRSDLADPAPALAQARERVAHSSLGDVAAVAVSAQTGAGLADLRAALDRLAAQLPAPDPSARLRLWVDRSFTIKGSGTVVTGTLAAGTLRVGEAVELGGRLLRVRGLQCLGTSYAEVSGVARVAVNLRGVERDEVRRGDVLLAPRTWPTTSTVDVRLAAPDLPAEVLLHIGTAAVPARVRPLGGDIARLTLARALPLQVGDRGILRDPGGTRLPTGFVALDVAPPGLRRRGAAAARAEALAAAERPSLLAEVTRRGAVRPDDLAALGIEVLPTEGVRHQHGWLVAEERWAAWIAQLSAAVAAHAASHPLEPAMPAEQARRAVGLPDLQLMPPLAAAAGLEHAGGRLLAPGTTVPVTRGIEQLAERLAAHAFDAPEQPALEALGLGRREIAAAVRAGRVLRLDADVLLLPDAPARAMQVLTALPQPFTASTARQALGTSRRVAIALLEHLDGRGWTRRVDRSLREVVLPAAGQRLGPAGC